MAKIKKFIKVTITGFIPAASSLDMDAFKLQHKRLQTARNAANETLEGVTFDVKEVNRKVEVEPVATAKNVSVKPKPSDEEE